MASLNRVILVGNLTRDPELRNIPDGTAVANFGIAVNRQFANKAGEKEVDFFNVVAWRKLAELCNQYLSKGSSVAIEGRLQSRSWETGEGQKRSTVEVVADNVQFLSRMVSTDNVKDSSKSEQPPAQELDDNIPLEEEPEGEDIPF
ncbi:MAG: single-stranded DNA-binding protein [Actinobacteria bacterium]|nr:MAG: single-stranded DNA-binding protein [Actinomycetota bacterium]